MTGGQAAVRSLLAHGVTDLFGLPGVQLDWFYNAIYDEGQPFNVYTTRHEQGAAYMALGYAATSGRVGVMSVVPGPGLLNAASGIATGYGLSVPLLCLVGQVPVRHIDQGRGQLHEIVDQPSITKNITKWQARASVAGEVEPLIGEAFRQMATGDPRPTMVELPIDVLGMRDDIEVAAPLTVEQPTPSSDDIGRAAALIAAAERPMLVVGGGALDAGEHVQALAHRIGAPVMTHRTGRGTIPDDDPLTVSIRQGYHVWSDIDLVICVGTRGQAVLDWGTDDGLRQIWINPDPDAAERMGGADVHLATRAEEALPLLLDAIDAGGEARAEGWADLDGIRADEQTELASLQPQLAYIDSLQRSLDEHDIIVSDFTQVGYVLYTAYNVRHPRTLVHPGYQGTLGYGLPTALGAKVANPDRRVVAVVGDGGFMFSATELATAVHYGIDVVTIVFDNAGFGNVRLMQREMYDGRVHATDLTNPDFVAMAQSFGAHAVRTDGRPESLDAALDEAFAAPGPSLVVVPMDEWPSPWGHFRRNRIRG